jgi:Leucine-rich repeat (LRR) protein
LQKFEINSPYFNGIRILYDYLLEGLDYAEKNNIKDVMVWVGPENNNEKQSIDFEFLKNKQFIEKFHWTVSLSKKSNINGLYYLSELKELRWAVDNDFKMDLSKFNKITDINIKYTSELYGWEKIKTLKRLFLSNVKTNDLNFLVENVNLEYLRIIRGKFFTINGLENCNKLKTLFLQNCSSLIEIKTVIQKINSLEQLNLENCKKIKYKEQLNGIKIKYISIIENNKEIKL